MSMSIGVGRAISRCRAIQTAALHPKGARCCRISSVERRFYVSQGLSSPSAIVCTLKRAGLAPMEVDAFTSSDSLTEQSVQASCAFARVGFYLARGRVDFFFPAAALHNARRPFRITKATDLAVSECICVATMQSGLFSFPLRAEPSDSQRETVHTTMASVWAMVNFLLSTAIGEEAESVKAALTASRMGEPVGKLATIFPCSLCAGPGDASFWLLAIQDSSLPSGAYTVAAEF